MSRKKLYVLHSTHYRRQTDEACVDAFFQSCYGNIKLKQHLLFFSFVLKNTVDLSFFTLYFFQQVSEEQKIVRCCEIVANQKTVIVTFLYNENCVLL